MSDYVRKLRDRIASPPVPWESTGMLLHHICTTAARALSASGAGISVLTGDGVRGVYAVTGTGCERVEELQFVLGEGPCVEAFATRRPVLVADLTDDAPRRWPGYTPAALAEGVRAVFAFPLQIGAARLGVLDVFRQRTGPLNGAELSLALSLADVAVEAVLDRQQSAGAGEAAHPAAEIERNAELFQAQGMVMVQLGVSLEEALVRLRAHAYAEDRRIDDVARDVVARRLRFDQSQ